MQSFTDKQNIQLQSQRTKKKALSVIQKWKHPVPIFCWILSKSITLHYDLILFLDQNKVMLSEVFLKAAKTHASPSTCVKNWGKLLRKLQFLSDCLIVSLSMLLKCSLEF